PEEIKKAEDASRGALRFFDVVPEIAGKGLGVDIMNPHYGDYYQAKRTTAYPNGTTPHDAGSPVPVFFLVVPQGSKFIFVVDCPREHRLPEALRIRWRDMIRAAFTHAFDWLGFGAKTAVGYGAMATHEPVSAAQAGVARGQKFDVDGKPAAASVSSQAQEAVWDKATLSLNPGTGEIKASFQGKSTAGLRGKEADALRDALGDRAARLKRDKQLKNVAVRVRFEGNMTLLLDLAAPEA
ncbi:MAG: type III-B CRISPR module RAMP protein Cmr6, partial [Betaproteobacteria bacterium RIFCSPLOWO2_12_FULL_62_13]